MLPSMSGEPGGRIRHWPLGNGVLLLVWDGVPAPAGDQLGIRVGDNLVAPPYCQLTLPLADGRARNLLSVAPGCRVDTTTPITICDETGTPLAARQDVPPPSPLADDGAIEDGTECVVEGAGEEDAQAWLDPLAILEGVPGIAEARFARFILAECGQAFRLARDPVFVGVCHTLIESLVADEQPLTGRCIVLERDILATTTLARSLAGPLQAFVVSNAMVMPTPFAPHRLGVGASEERATCGLLVPAVAARSDSSVLIFGDSGLMIAHSCTERAALPTAGEWLTRPQDDQKGLRRYLVECMARLSQTSEDAAALLREIWLCLAAGGFKVADATQPVAAGATWILGSEAGTFVTGWLNDRYRLVAGLDVEAGGGRAFVPLDRLVRFPPREPLAGNSGAPDRPEPEWQFAAFIANREPTPAAAPCRLALRMRSGTRLAFAEGPSPVGGREARDIVLRTVLPTHATETALAECIEPAVRAFEEEISRMPIENDVIDIRGFAARPAASLVILLSERTSILRCRAGLFATDPAMADIEVIYVAADPRAWWRMEAPLRDLLASYALGARVVFPSRPCSLGEALNAGASIARTPLIAFLGAGVVPEERGWIAKLTAALGSKRQRGLVGGRILFEDSSLGHAGADLSLNERGSWAVQRRYAGFPRDYAAASGSGPVPVVSSACLMTHRALFEENGGFSTDYLGQAYADADLSFKVRSTGAAVWHAAEAVMFDLGNCLAQDGDPNSVAAMLDQRQLTHRWRAEVDHSDSEIDAPPSGPRQRRAKVAA